MTISSATSRIAYTGNSSTTAFAVPFYFAANADLVVTVQDTNGAVTTKTLGSDYNLTGATLSAGGTCTFVTAPTTAYIIAITRVPPITQLTSYNNNDPFAAKSHELALDKAATIDQYLKSLIDRAILVPSTDTPPYTTLPAASQRALKNLSFDAAGNPSASTPVTGTTISSVMIPVATASTLAQARATFFGTPGTNEAITINSNGAGDITVGALGTGNAILSVTGAGLVKLLYGSTGHLWVGNGSFSADDTAILVNRALTPGSGLLNSHAYRDETQATQNVTGSAFSGYAAYDAAGAILGVATTPMNHIRNFQARMNYNSTGTVNEMAGLWVGHVVSNGTVASMYGVHVIDVQKINAPTITNQYAFYSDPLLLGTNNYFLWGEGSSNPSILKGKLFVGGRVTPVSTEQMNVQYDGSTTQGFLFNDTYSPAGSLTAFSFYRNGSNVGTVSTTLTNTAYNTSSDERLKTFTGHYSAADAISLIRADPVRTFTWDTTGDAAIGWGAQTSYALSPDLASPGVGDLDDVNFHPWGIDFSKRVPYLWAATASLVDRVEALETENTALKGRLAAIEARLTAAGI